jgi:hypothetical protein
MVTFHATEIGYLEEFDTVSCGASNADSTDEYHYINFQRAAKIGSPDDTGIYFELDDQVNSGFNIIESCELSPNQLTIKLSEKLNSCSGEIIVSFNSYASKDLQPINEGLKKIFLGYESLLKVSV